MKKIVVVVVAVCCTSIGFFAGRISPRNGASKPTVATAPLQVDNKQRDSLLSSRSAAGDNLLFNDAVINQRGPTATSSFVSFTLRGKWSNQNSFPVTIFYDVLFYDESGVELYRSARFKDVDANSATVTPQVISTFEGKASDDFDYRAVKEIVVKFVAKGSNAEKSVVRNIPIRLID